MADELLVGFASNAGNGYDAAEDALKLYGDASAPQVYTLAGDYKTSINALGELNGNMQIPLNYECGSQGEVAFVFSQLESFPANMAIRLEDRLTGQMINLRQQQRYTFTHQTGNAAERFVLHFSSATGVDDLPSATNGKVWVNGHTVNIAVPASTGGNAKVEIFSMTGQHVFNQQVILGELTKIQVNLSGMFIIRVTTSKETMVSKGILR